MTKYTVEYMKEKMQEAYKNRKLLAQNVSKFKKGYFYQKGSYGCAVGVCLTKEDADKLLGDKTLTANSILVVETMFPSGSDAKDFACWAQSLHDTWAGALGFSGATRQSDEDIAEDRNAFKAHIDLA